MRPIRLGAIAVWILVLLAGCSGGGGRLEEPTPEISVFSGEVLPQAPGTVLDGIESRTASLVFERTAANLPPDMSSRVEIVGDTAWFIPYWESCADEGANLAYGIYRFATTDLAQHELLLDWQTVPVDPSELWIGLANWDEQRWDWFPGLADGGIELDQAGYGEYVHPDSGELLVVIMLTGTDKAGLRGISIAEDQRGAWPTYQHDPQRTGRSEFEGPQVADVKWMFQTTGDGTTLYNFQEGPDGRLFASAGPELIEFAADGTILWRSEELFQWFAYHVVRPDGSVIVASYKGVTALNSDLSVRWHYPADCSTMPVIGPDGAIHVGTFLGGLLVLNPDGTERRTLLPGEMVDIGPAVGADGTVYFVCKDEGDYPVDGHLYAAGPDGSLLWSAELWDCIADGPRVAADGTVFVESYGNLFAFDSAGNELWQYNTGDTFPYLTNLDFQITDTVYVGAERKVIALNLDGSVKWECDLAGTISARLEIGPDGKIYAGAGQDVHYQDSYPDVYCITPDGTVEWSTRTDNTVASVRLLASSGTVLAGCHLDKLYALDSAGDIGWTLGAGGAICSSPVTAADGTIYFGCDDNRLYAVNPDGTLKWCFETDGQIRSAPAIGYDGTIYFGGLDYIFYALSPGGELQWSFTTGNQILDSPTVAEDGTVYVTSNDGKLYALDHSGELLWAHDDGAWGGYTTPALTRDGSILVGSGDDGGVLALSSTGGELWTVDTRWLPTMPMISLTGDFYCVGRDGLQRFAPDGDEVWSVQIQCNNAGAYPAVAAGEGRVLAIGSPGEDGMLYSYDLDGNLLWSFETETWSWAPPVADAAGNAYLTHSWHLTAVSADGTEIWDYKASDSFNTSGAIGADGTLYIGSENGRLYAFGQ